MIREFYCFGGLFYILAVGFEVLDGINKRIDSLFVRVALFLNLQDYSTELFMMRQLRLILAKGFEQIGDGFGPWGVESLNDLLEDLVELIRRSSDFFFLG